MMAMMAQRQKEKERKKEEPKAGDAAPPAWASSGRSFGDEPPPKPVWATTPATVYDDDETPAWAKEAEQFFAGKQPKPKTAEMQPMKSSPPTGDNSAFLPPSASAGSSAKTGDGLSSVERLAKASGSSVVEEVGDLDDDENPELRIHQQRAPQDQGAAGQKMTNEQRAMLNGMAKKLEGMTELGTGLRKRILRREPNEQKSQGRPPKGSTVTIDWTAYIFPEGELPFASTRKFIEKPGATLQDRQTQAERPSGPQTFVLGEGEVPPAMDTTVETMLPGEVCEIVAAPNLAYGENGAPHLGVPPNMPIKFELQLLSWSEKRPERENLSALERLFEAKTYKEKGTEKFRRSKFKDAMDLYDIAASYVDDGFHDGVSVPAGTVTFMDPRMSGKGEAPPPLFSPGEEEAEARSLLLSCLLNGAQMGIRMESWRDAERRAELACALDKKSAKAWYRRGVAAMKLGDYEDSTSYLRRANQLEPKSQEIREAFEMCQLAQADAKDQMRELYSNTQVASGGYEYVEPEKTDEEKPFIC